MTTSTKKLITILIALLMPCTPPVAAASKKIVAVTCEGKAGWAHTLIVGNCSFTGAEANTVETTCKEDSTCHVEARGWDNGQEIFIVTRVDSVKLISPPQPD